MSSSKEEKRKQTTSDEMEEHAYIHQEVLLQILQKLPAKTLVKFCCVCKLWFESIRNDRRFIEDHLLESQKNPTFIFKFKFLPIPSESMEDLECCSEYDMNDWFYLDKDKFVSGKSKVLPYIQDLTVLKDSYCNGLVCSCSTVSVPSSRHQWSDFVIDIFNFSKHEKLRVISRIHGPAGTRVDCSLGYDVSAKEYKLMCILEGGEVYDYRYMILTLGGTGTQSWREIKHPIEEGYSLEVSSRSPNHCIDGALFWEALDTEENTKVLCSLDLHDENFQVIKPPNALGLFLTDYDSKLEYKRCLCYAKVKKADTHTGVVELYLLKDRVKQVWVKESIPFDLSVTVQNSPDVEGGTIPSLSNEGDTSFRVIEFAGRIYLHWRKLVQGEKSHIILFYDLHSKRLTGVEVPAGGECCHDYQFITHVENLVSLKAWATNEGDGRGGVLQQGRNFDACSSREIEDIFKQMPASTDDTVVSLFSSLTPCLFSLSDPESTGSGANHLGRTWSLARHAVGPHESEIFQSLSQRLGRMRQEFSFTD